MVCDWGELFAMRLLICFGISRALDDHLSLSPAMSAFSSRCGKIH